MSGTYRHCTADEIAAMSKGERAAYQANRNAFDAEVAEHVAHGREHGWIDVGTAGKVSRFHMPVTLERGGQGVHRSTLHIGIRGAS